MDRNLISAFTGPFAVATMLATLLAAAGCASATAGTTAAKPGASADGRANLIAYSIDSDGPYFSAVVTGAVGDYGPAVTVDPDGAVDPEHGSQLELKLVHGSFRLSISSLDDKLVQATAGEPVYPRTCSTFVDVTAGTPVVPGSGTGSYRDIAGSFTMTVTVDEVHAQPCTPAHLSFIRQVIMLSGPGTISLG
ncbi:MAG TPA: hypothetical protein VMU95_24345 [Trebonia sp.]|nr:hypothetical protein [Trebonia sp.]